MRFLHLFPRPSFRALLAFLTCVYFGIFAALTQKDILAASVSLSLTAVILGVFLYTFFLKQILRGVEAPDIWLNQTADSKLRSRIPYNLAVRFSSILVPPFARLSCQLMFENNPGDKKIHFFPVMRRGEFILTEKVIFPHRGKWRVTELRLSFKDAFGLFTVEKNIKIGTVEFKVYPPEGSSVVWPLMASEVREGSDIPTNLKRAGDYLDIKSYEPADGVRKILWKKFAKSGELVSRQPEFASSIEGKCIIFGMIEKNDDSLASAVIEYIKKLDEYGVEVVFGCHGSPLPEDGSIAEDKIIENVFLPADSHSLQAGVSEFASHLKSESNIVCPISISLVADEESSKVINIVSSVFRARNSAPHFMLNTSGISVKEDELQPFLTRIRTEGLNLSY